MRCSQRGYRRQGVVTLELILVICVLLTLLIAAVMFGTLLVLKGTVAHAATVAAREAGKLVDTDPACTAQQLAPIVQKILDVHCIPLSDNSGTGTKITLQVASPATTTWYGGLACTAPATPALSSDEVRVTVCIALSATRFCSSPSFFGVTLGNVTLQASAVAKKEKS